MADHPIIFSAPTIRALLDGRKAMTRRLAWRKEEFVTEVASEHQEDYELRGVDCQEIERNNWRIRYPSRWQKVKPGDRLLVREGGFLISHANWHNPTTREDVWEPVGWRYAADDVIAGYNGHEPGGYIDDCAEDRRPSIHMPRWASRLTLTVTATKIERLQEITPEDAEAEGLWYCEEGDAAGFWFAGPDMQGNVSGDGTVECFASLWASLHGPDSWAANPEVVALTFTVHKANIDSLEKAA